MLTLDRRRLCDGARRLGAGARRWRGGLEPREIAAGGERKGGAEQKRRGPKAAAHRLSVPSRTYCHNRYSCLSELIPANHFNLPHPEHFDPRSATILDPAANTNSSIFEGFENDACRLERRYYAP
jgi:hypothetical protein